MRKPFALYLTALLALAALTGCASGPAAGAAGRSAGSSAVSGSGAASGAASSGPETPGGTPGAASSAAASSAAASSAPEETPDPVPALLEGMTLEEKVGQLFFVRCPESGAAADAAAFHLGGILFFGRDFRDRTANEIIQALNACQEAARADTGIPLLLGADEEGGTVVRISSNPNLCAEKFRSPQQLYADGGMEEITADAHEKDVLLRALGLNVNFAPVCDVSTDPADFLYPRTFGQDARGTCAYVAAVEETMAQDGMGSVLKHFPGYGNNADTHTGSATDTRPLETFLSSDLLPFQAGAGASDGTAAVLVCHNIVAALDGSLPASLSPAVHELLRRTLGTAAVPFGGVVMTDDLAMEAVQAYAAGGKVAVLALRAGNDMVCTTDYRTQIPAVLEAVRAGTLPESAVDGACRRVLTWKRALGLL